MIKVDGLVAEYGKRTVLKGLHLRIEDGQTVIIHGPSGCGKTTLLRLIAGLERPRAGLIEIAGAVVSKPHHTVPPHRRGIAIVMQQPALWPHLTVQQHLEFVRPESSRRSESTRIIDELLERSGLADLSHRRPAELSGGEARRVSIIRALAASSPILLLDEPLVSLDDALCETMRELIVHQIASQHRTAIWVSHDLGGLEHDTRIFTLENGRLHPLDSPGYPASVY